MWDPFFNFVMAQTPEEKALAAAALHAQNRAQPSDRAVLAGFLKDCTTLDGRALLLDPQGRVVVAASGEA